MSYRKKWFDNNKSTITGKYRCSHCGKKYRKKYIDIDHIVPRSRGGTNELANLQALCRYCNRSKGNNMNDTEYDIMSIQKKHKKDEGYYQEYIPKPTDKFCFVCNKKISVFFTVELDNSGVLCRDCYRLVCRGYRRKKLYLGNRYRAKLNKYNKREIREIIKNKH
ncbi:MAG: HNH endonuclease [Lachnospiraceae bacterium]|nr:HNH endonuclease [Lachnospiraceae bacterium]